MAALQQRLTALEAEVAALREAVVLRDSLLGALEDRAYRRGGESILGTREAATAPRSRHLQAVQAGPQ